MAKELTTHEIRRLDLLLHTALSLKAEVSEGGVPRLEVSRRAVAQFLKELSEHDRRLIGDKLSLDARALSMEPDFPVTKEWLHFFGVWIDALVAHLNACQPREHA